MQARLAGVPNGYDVYYTTDGSNPTVKSLKYTGPITITKDAEINAGVIYNGILVDEVNKTFTINKATGHPSTLVTPANKSYNKGGEHAWNNGILGSDNRFNDGEWLGWSGQDFDGTIDLGTSQYMDTITTRFFNKPSDWVYMPQWVSISVSDNGVDFKEVARLADLQTNKDGSHILKIGLGHISARYLKIVAKCDGIIPKGSPGEGNQAWLFVDEVKVE